MITSFQSLQKNLVCSSIDNLVYYPWHTQFQAHFYPFPEALEWPGIQIYFDFELTLKHTTEHLDLDAEDILGSQEADSHHEAHVDPDTFYSKIRVDSSHRRVSKRTFNSLKAMKDNLFEEYVSVVYDENNLIREK